LDLVFVDVQSRDVAAGELDDFASGASHTTANIQDSHIRLYTYGMSQVMFVASNGARECLAIGKLAKVERLAPAVFVKVGSQVVISAIRLRWEHGGNGCNSANGNEWYEIDLLPC
jgi:hypothetical protein